MVSSENYFLSWLITYMNFVFTMGLVGMSLWIASKFFKFVCSERQKYQPHNWLIMLKEILTCNSFMSLVVQWLKPNTTDNNVLKRLNELEKLAREYEKSSPECVSPTSQCVSPTSQCVSPTPDVLFSIIRSSVDLSDLDAEVKDKFINSFSTFIQSLKYINNNKTDIVLERIRHNIHSYLEFESDNNPKYKEWLNKNSSDISLVLDSLLDIISYTDYKA
jgi:hypothetical protein